MGLRFCSWVHHSFIFIAKGMNWMRLGAAFQQVCKRVKPAAAHRADLGGQVLAPKNSFDGLLIFLGLACWRQSPFLVTDGFCALIQLIFNPGHDVQLKNADLGKRFFPALDFDVNCHCLVPLRKEKSTRAVSLQDQRRL